MLPPPPDLLTTLSVDGMSLFVTRMRSTVRAVLSLLPPGGLGTTSSTFFCGAHDWAGVTELKAARIAAVSNLFMLFLAVGNARCAISASYGRNGNAHRVRQWRTAIG